MGVSMASKWRSVGGGRRLRASLQSVQCDAWSILWRDEHLEVLWAEVEVDT